MSMPASHAPDVPIDGNPLLIAAAKASVPASRLPDLLAIVQTHLHPLASQYRRSFERIHREDGRELFFVPTDHWEELGETLGFDRRERDAVQRAHEEQLRRIGSTHDRREEFETALELRSVVVIGTEDGDRSV